MLSGTAACPVWARRAATHLGSLPVARPAAEVDALAHHVEERFCCRHCAPLSAALCTHMLGLGAE